MVSICLNPYSSDDTVVSKIYKLAKYLTNSKASAELLAPGFTAYFFHQGYELLFPGIHCSLELFALHYLKNSLQKSVQDFFYLDEF